MHQSHFHFMQIALDIESQSPHPDHKVGAVIHGKDKNGQEFTIARSNFWSPALEEKIGRENKLGNASTTVHAEIAALCNAPFTEQTTLYITDLPCPNCAKAMAETRIKTLYIDSDTHNTPLGLKIKPFFDNISLPILKSAGIEIYELHTKTKTSKLILDADSHKLIEIEHPAVIIPINKEISDKIFQEYIRENAPTSPFAACFAKSPLGNIIFMLTRPHRSIGLSKEHSDQLSNLQTKYLPTLQPVNRLLLNCARHGYKILPDYIFSSRVPTSREFVNLIGNGYTSLFIGDTSQSRDEFGLQALEQLQKLNIISLK